MCQPLSPKWSINQASFTPQMNHTWVKTHRALVISLCLFGLHRASTDSFHTSPKDLHELNKRSSYPTIIIHNYYIIQTKQVKCERTFKDVPVSTSSSQGNPCDRSRNTVSCSDNQRKLILCCLWLLMFSTIGTQPLNLLSPFTSFCVMSSFCNEFL